MREPKFEKPTIAFSKSGVMRVTAADILQSKLGRAEIQKAANVAVSRELRKDSSDATCILKSTK